ncbi:hypothetical protein BKA63DRAFT_591335 [Paraphoma chrysanthemicola]|nr:hypothetical protein BKA63DRAFT_591335 [Paraphoma chrysanthemicola]
MLHLLSTLVFSVIAAGQDVPLPPRKVPFAAPNIKVNTNTLTTQHLLIPASALYDSLEGLIGSEVSLSQPTPTPHPMQVVVQSSASILSNTMWLNPKVPPPNYSLKRSADLYSLHVPFSNGGYAELFLSNSTAAPFCQHVSTSLFEDSTEYFVDLKIKFRNSSATVPIREDEAVAFCQNVQKHERASDKAGSMIEPSNAATTRNANPKYHETKSTYVAKTTTTRLGKGSPNPASNLMSAVTTDTQFTPSVVPLEVDDEGLIEDAKETELSSSFPESERKGESKPTVPAETTSQLGDIQKSGSKAPSSRVVKGGNLGSSIPTATLAEPPTTQISKSGPFMETSGLQEVNPDYPDESSIKKIPKESRLASHTLIPATTNAADDNYLVAEVSHEQMFNESHTTISGYRAASMMRYNITTAPGVRKEIVQVQEIGHQASPTQKTHFHTPNISSPHEYTDDEELTTEHPNGAAISARALQNAASRLRPFGAGLLSRGINGIWTQLIHPSTCRKPAKQRPDIKTSVPASKPKSKHIQSSRLKESSPTPVLNNPTNDITSADEEKFIAVKPTHSATSRITDPHTSIVPNPEKVSYSLISASAARLPPNKLPKPTATTSSKRPSAPKATHKPSNATAVNDQDAQAVNSNSTLADEANDSSTGHLSTNSSSNHTFHEPGHGHLSSAFGGTEDRRILWTVLFVWVLVLLQVVMSVWEFGRSAWGWKGKTYDRLLWKV